MPLPDLNTTNPTVISGYQSWIKQLVQTYNIDGLRIDAAKYAHSWILYSIIRLRLTRNIRHVNIDFWPQFCGAAGVYCIGEVFGDDIGYVARYIVFCEPDVY